MGSLNIKAKNKSSRYDIIATSNLLTSEKPNPFKVYSQAIGDPYIKAQKNLKRKITEMGKFTPWSIQKGHNCES